MLFEVLRLDYALSHLRVGIDFELQRRIDVVENDLGVAGVVHMRAAVRTGCLELLDFLFLLFEVVDAESAYVVLAACSDKNVIEVAQADWTIVTELPFVLLSLLVHNLDRTYLKLSIQ